MYLATQYRDGKLFHREHSVPIEPGLNSCLQGLYEAGEFTETVKGLKRNRSTRWEVGLLNKSCFRVTAQAK